MKHIKIATINADLSIRLMYTCSYCGKEQKGDPLQLEFRQGDLADLITFVSNNNHRLIPSHMPVGWAHYGNGVFHCGCDKEKQS